MAGFLGLFGGKPEEKSIQTKTITTFDIAEAIDNDIAASTRSTYGYGQANSVLLNPVAKKCIDTIAASASAIPIYVTKNGDEVADLDPVAKLFAKPNSYTSVNELIDNLVRDYLLYGNSYVHRLLENKDFQRGFGQIFRVEPRSVNPIGGKNIDFPEAWNITPTRGQGFQEPVDQVTGQSRLLQIRTYSTTANYLGQAPAASAWAAIQAFEAGSAWNTKTLANNGGFTAIIQPDLKDGEDVDATSWAKFITELNNFYTKKRSILAPNMPVKVIEMSKTSKDQQLIESQEANSRQIAVAFGVPTQVIGIPGDSTYANYEQAQYALYNNNVIPMMEKFISELEAWIQGIFPKQGYELNLDLDQIPALQTKRTEAMTAIASVPFLSDNEKRALFGFDPIAVSNGTITPAGDTSDEE